MRAKIFISALIFLFFFSCKDEAVNPYSPVIPKNGTRIEFRIEMFTEVEDIVTQPPNHYYWFIIAETYIDNKLIGEMIINFGGKGRCELSQIFIPYTNYQVGDHKIRFKFKDTDIPMEWQESVGFIFTAKLKTVDSDFEIIGGMTNWFPGWNAFGTGYFKGWKVGDWKIPLYASTNLFYVSKR